MCQANYCPEMLRPCAMAMPIWNALKGDHSWWAVALGFQSPTFENPVWDRLTAHRALTDSRPKTRWKKREKGRSLILNVVSTKTKLVYFPGPSTQAWDMPKWLKAFAFSRSIEDGHTGPIINLETCFNVFLLGSCKRISFNDCLTSQPFQGLNPPQVFSSNLAMTPSQIDLVVRRLIRLNAPQASTNVFLIQELETFEIENLWVSHQTFMPPSFNNATNQDFCWPFGARPPLDYFLSCLCSLYICVKICLYYNIYIYIESHSL